MGTLQLVARGAAEPGVPTGVQAADRDVTEGGPCREGAAQQVGWGWVAMSRSQTDPPIIPRCGGLTPNTLNSSPLHIVDVGDAQ